MSNNMPRPNWRLQAEHLANENERLRSDIKTLQDQIVRIQGELDAEITARGKLEKEIERLLAQVEELELAALW